MKKQVDNLYKANKPVFYNRLCSVIDFRKEQELFNIRPVTGLPFTPQLRFVWLPNDLPCIQKWLHEEYRIRHVNIPALDTDLQDTYLAIGQSTYAQALMAIIDTEAVAVVVVQDIRFDELSVCNEFGDGVYIIRILTDPPKKAIPGWFRSIVETISGYCYSFPEVKQLVLELNNTPDIKLAEACGFPLLQTIPLKWVEVALFYVHQPA